MLLFAAWSLSQKNIMNVAAVRQARGGESSASFTPRNLIENNERIMRGVGLLGRREYLYHTSVEVKSDEQTFDRRTQTNVAVLYCCLAYLV